MHKGSQDKAEPLKPGKVPPAALERSVLPYAGRKRPEVLLGASLGEDAAVLDLGGDLCVLTVDPITGTGHEAGALAVHVSANDLVAAGAEPVGVLLNVLVREGTTEAELARLMAGADGAARSLGMQVLGGHTEVTPGLGQTIVTAAAVGRVPMGRQTPSGGLRPGDELVLTKGAGIEGTAILAWDLGEELAGQLGRSVVERARAFSMELSVVAEGRLAARAGATALHDVTEGGVLGAVYELAAAAGVGVEVALAQIPVRPETEAICRFLGLDPLRLISSGSLLIGIRAGAALVQELQKNGIGAAVIGRAVPVEGGMTVITTAGEAVPLEPPESDELWRVKTREPQHGTRLGASVGGGVAAIHYEQGILRLLDQRRLPRQITYISCSDHLEVADAIRNMVVRGAPAIGVAAAYGLALAARRTANGSAGPRDVLAALREAAGVLRQARPTAINLAWALDRMLAAAEAAGDCPAAALVNLMEAEAGRIHREDAEMNVRLAGFGLELVPDGGILTHCNAGALATGGYGTALGVIRAARDAGRKIHVFVGETRPFLQGSRLTAFELQTEGIPATLITDNMAGHFMQRGAIDLVIVGADRIAANGDTANKIGTYSLAVLAREHGIPFVVAAPVSTVDFKTPTGEEIPIEERDPMEVTRLAGVELAPPGMAAANPAFDVTPARYIAAIVTERGVVRPPLEEGLRALNRP